MNRFEQRLKKRLQNPEFAAGYQEMGSEIALIAALDQVRESLQISKEDLAERMGRSRESISRLLNSQHPNPTLETLLDMLRALGITADVSLRRSNADEDPLTIKVMI